MSSLSELTYNHTIKLEDEALTFDIRDTIEKVRLFKNVSKRVLSNQLYSSYYSLLFVQAVAYFATASEIKLRERSFQIVEQNFSQRTSTKHMSIILFITDTVH